MKTWMLAAMAAAGAFLVLGLDRATAALGESEETDAMYGLIGEMKATPGQREALMKILLDGVSGMPGCLSYVVAKDPASEDTIWITEVWESKASHQASLALASVQEAIAKGRPLIAGFGERIETAVVGGHGLAPVAKE